MLVRLMLSGLFMASFAQAQDLSNRGQAQWMLERVTGVKWPANSPVIDEMENKISAGDRIGAAEVATQQPQFINVSVKQLALKISSREETVNEALNDFTAAFMGTTRDNTDARELLSGNFYYRGTTNTNDNLVPDMLNSNNHYVQLNKQADVGAGLVRVEGQMILSNNTTAVANPDPAGVLTSRAWLAAHAVAGTNRRLIEFTFREFMCTKIENWADTNGSDARIGRDISRSPAGDPTKFQSSCKGCHVVMDGFRGAFANWDFISNGNTQAASYLGISTGGLASPTAINGQQLKYNRDRNQNNFIEYASGYITTDNSWINNANRSGSANATRFGWNGAGTGTGVKSFGTLVANSSRFTSCMAKRVWDSVCKYELSEAEAETMYVSLGLQFASNGYKLRELYKTVAANPKCRM